MQIANKKDRWAAKVLKTPLKSSLKAKTLAVINKKKSNQQSNKSLTLNLAHGTITVSNSSSNRQ